MTVRRGVEMLTLIHLSGSKLSLTSLLQPLPETSSTSLLKTAKALAPAALAAPLPTRTQEKLDRAAAYDATKDEVAKWAPAMKRIKEVGRPCCWRSGPL